jgi:hypothetical protein
MHRLRRWPARTRCSQKSKNGLKDFAHETCHQPVQIAANRVEGMKVDEMHSGARAAPGSAPLAQKTRAESQKKEPGKRDRRARGTAPADRSKTSVKRSNGHPRVNGHDRASSPSAAFPADGQGSAASVDASGASVASAAASAAAGAGREAYAEAAPAAIGSEKPRQATAGPRPRIPGDANSRNSADEKPDPDSEKEKRPSRPGPGEYPLPEDIADFVDEIHSRIDLFEILSDLLGSKDEKVKQRALEKLLEMKYGRSAESNEEPVQIIMNAPRPQRD